MNIDETALNVLLPDTDAATAIVGSVIHEPTTLTPTDRRAWDFGLVIGVVVGVVWYLSA